MNILDALFLTPTAGGLIAITVLTGAGIIYAVLTRWIIRGGQEEKPSWERMGWPYKE